MDPDGVYLPAAQISSRFGDGILVENTSGDLGSKEETTWSRAEQQNDS